MPATAIALFTRDLRVHDNPVLAAAAWAEQVVPLFVHDTALERTGFAAERRSRFLGDCLADPDARLRDRGAALIQRHGDLASEVVRLTEETDVGAVHLAADVSAFAATRRRRLTAALAERGRRLVVHDAVHTVLAPEATRPPDGDHISVFTPYHRRWASTPRRDPVEPPRRLRLPPSVAVPDPVAAPDPAAAWCGGETEARRRARHWLPAGADDYQDRHDDLGTEHGTSRLSPYLHFGCLSALELATEASARGTAGAQAFVRQLAWRDFHAQVLAARPDAAQRDFRPRDITWRTDDEALRAWQTGRTGVPIVDAGMRQLAAEGWLHNRARLITGSFLTTTLRLDWRAAAAHFLRQLLDGDIANNQLNWQWIAGTGTDTRPYRVLNPLRQADRFDPAGDYVRRWVPELSTLDDPRDVHRPWRMGAGALDRLGYPAPIVDLDHARDRSSADRQLALDL